MAEEHLVSEPDAKQADGTKAEKAGHDTTGSREFLTIREVSNKDIGTGIYIVSYSQNFRILTGNELADLFEKVAGMLRVLDKNVQWINT